MIRRRIEGLYGSGAARIALCSEAFHVGDPDDSLRRAGELFVNDLRELGFRRALGLGGAPVVALVLLVMYLAASALFRPVHEASDIELVPFEVARVVPPPPAVLERPPAPARELEPPAVVKPEPPPAVAKPEPPTVAKPVPPPAVPLKTPKPPPPERKLRREPPPAPAPPPRARPRVEMDRLAAVPPPQAPEPGRRQRAAAERANAPRSRVALAPLAAAPALNPGPEAAEPRTRQRFRVPAGAPSASAPRVRVDAMPASMDRVAVEPTRTRRQRVAPAPRRPSQALRPELAVTASQRLPEGDSPPRTGRAARVAASPKTTRRRPTVDVAALGAMADRAPGGAPSTRSVRLAAAAAPQGPAGRQSPDEELRGVSLGSLAACRSDADEDLLKQRVVAAVTTQKECLSRAGHYRFLQTGNLNSFLMWVERSSGRTEADRCVELRHALECLKRQQRTESGSG